MSGSSDTRKLASLGLILLLAVSAPAVSQSGPPDCPELSAKAAAAVKKIQAEQRRLAGELEKVLADPKGKASERNALLTQYRSMVVAELVVRMAKIPKDQQVRCLTEFRKANSERWRTIRESAFDFLVERIRLANSDRERALAYAQVQSALRQFRIVDDVAVDALERFQPWARSGVSDFVSTTVALQQRLIDEISEAYLEKPNTFLDESDGDVRTAKREVDQWLKRLERDLDIEEFMRVADRGLILDQQTNEPIRGQLRDRVAKNAKLELVELLRKNGVEPSLIRSVFGWADSRLDLAQQIEQEVKRDDRYRALDFIAPSTTDADMSTVFLAMANVVRRDVQEVLDWRAKLIPEGGGKGIPGSLYEWFVAKQKVGLGLAISIGSGELADTDGRIATLEREANVVVTAFRAAAKFTPKELAEEFPDYHKLLETFGFIGKAKAGEYYRLPDNVAATARLRKDLKLPGASVLDVISGQNAIKAVLLVAAPELVSAKFAAMLEGLELGGAVIMTARVGTEIAASGGLSAVDQYATKGKVQWDRVVLESVALGPALMGVSTTTAFASKQLAKVLQDPAKRGLAEMAVRGSLGLSSEAAIQAYWEARIQNRGVTYEDFLGQLLNGVMSRSVRVRGSVKEAIGHYQRRQRDIPDEMAWLKKETEENEALAAELRSNFDRPAALERRFDAAARRLLDVVGDEATTRDLVEPAVIRKVTEALESGKLTWEDIKTVFTETMPWQLEPFMAAVNAHRLQLFVGIVAKAQQRARSQLLGEYLRENDRIRREMPRKTEKEQAEFRTALESTRARYERELGLINAELKVPGSSNLTSDIDRSVASPRVRNELKKLTDEAFWRTGNLPATSAKAYDVNEYIDVFLVINRMRKAGESLEGLDGGTPGLKHGEEVEAHALAHAMMHMLPGERARYKANLLAQAGIAGQKVQAQLDAAEASLARGKQELRQELTRMGLDPDAASSDQILRARDNLYGKRTVELGEMEARLEKMDPKSQEAKELAAQIERTWNFALREGIEAYSDFTGLDVIVNVGQLNNRSVRELINDPNFSASNRGYTKLQVSGMLHNQTGMIVEHMHAYHLGKESATTAAGAVGKYAERAVLALKLQGVDLTSGRAQELSAISEALVKVRKDPDALRAELQKFGDGDGDVGFLKLAGLLEQTLPGMKGLLAAPDRALLPGPAGTAVARGRNAASDVAGGSALSRNLAALALGRERDRDRRRTQALSGTRALLLEQARRLASLVGERKNLQETKAREAGLGQSYLRKDWTLAGTLEDQREALRRQIGALPVQRIVTSVHKGLRSQEQAVTARLAELNQKFIASGGPSSVKPTQADRRRDARLANLGGEIAGTRKELDRLAAVAKEQATRLAKVKVSPPKGTGSVVPNPGSELDAVGRFLMEQVDTGKIRYPTPKSASEKPASSDIPSSGGTPSDIGRRGASGGAGDRTAGVVGGTGPVTGAIPPIDYELRPRDRGDSGDGTFPDLRSVAALGHVRSRSESAANDGGLRARKQRGLCHRPSRSRERTDARCPASGAASLGDLAESIRAVPSSAHLDRPRFRNTRCRFLPSWVWLDAPAPRGRAQAQDLPHQPRHFLGRGVPGTYLQ